VEALEDRLVLSGDLVLRWNSIALAAIRVGAPIGPLANRALAIVQAAVYDAVNSIDQTHHPYLTLISAPSGASEDAAAAQAAHDALVALFPPQVLPLDLQLKASLQGIADGDAKTAGIMVGQTAAQNILAARANDGSDKTVDYTPGTNPGQWQPTPPAFAPALAPQWGSVTPFSLQSGSQFRPPPPPALTSPEYTADFNQVKDVGALDSTTRTADQTEAALFWQAIVTPNSLVFGMWDQVAQQVAIAKGNSLVENARLFALLHLTMADAQIAAWDAKYTYNFWRPVTAIRAADTDGNPDTNPDPNWSPLFPTPNYPSYPSGHATVSGGSATVLASYFGSDAIPFTLSFEGLPGVTRSYASFSAAEAEAGMARVWGGIHYGFEITAAHAMGEAIGAYVVQNFLLPVGGASRPPRGNPPGAPGNSSMFIALVVGTAGERFASTLTGSVGQGSLASGSFSDTAPIPANIRVQPGTTGVGDGLVSDPFATALFRAQLENAQLPTHASSVDDVFSSVHPWGGTVDWVE
jgi:membrane-associated phospholipid phosphatase